MVEGPRSLKKKHCQSPRKESLLLLQREAECQVDIHTEIMYTCPSTQHTCGPLLCLSMRLQLSRHAECVSAHAPSTLC